MIEDDITSARTEVGAALAAQVLGDLTAARDVQPGDTVERIIPTGYKVEKIDYEWLLDSPRRPQGDIRTFSADGFIRAVEQRRVAGEPVSVYADEQNRQLVCILDDDQNGVAGWRQHRVSIALRTTVEWDHWASQDGKLIEQEKFGEHLERGMREILDPPASTLLSLVTAFEAEVKVEFQGGFNSATGARTLVVQQQIDASAGGATIAVPERFRILVVPFLGGDAAQVEAAFRFRVNDRSLKLGYVLDYPHLVLRAAFLAVCEKVAGELGTSLIEGIAPAPRGG